MKIYNKGAAGVIIFAKSSQSVLVGLRSDGQGWGFAGGKREACDRCSKDTALRELQEEFGVVIPAARQDNLRYIKRAMVPADRIDRATGKLLEHVMFFTDIYLYCVEDKSEISLGGHDDETKAIKWVTLKEFARMDNIFTPSLIAFNVAMTDETMRALAEVL